MGIISQYEYKNAPSGDSVWNYAWRLIVPKKDINTEKKARISPSLLPKYGDEIQISFKYSAIMGISHWAKILGVGKNQTLVFKVHAIVDLALRLIREITLIKQTRPGLQPELAIVDKDDNIIYRLTIVEQKHACDVEDDD